MPPAAVISAGAVESGFCCTQAGVYSPRGARALANCMAMTAAPASGSDGIRGQVDLAMLPCLFADDAAHEALATLDGGDGLNGLPPPPRAEADGDDVSTPIRRVFALVPHLFQHGGRPTLYSHLVAADETLS